MLTIHARLEVSGACIMGLCGGQRCLGWKSDLAAKECDWSSQFYLTDGRHDAQVDERRA